jgi:hypothetical protein
MDLQKQLISRLTEAANEINKSSRHGSANYIMVSNYVANMILNNKSSIRKDKINKIFN